MKMTKTGARLSAICLAVASLMSVSHATFAADDSATINVTATVKDNTCTPGWDTNGTTVDLGNLNGAHLTAKGAEVGKKSFTLALKECGKGAKTVKVTAAGTADSSDADGFAVDSGDGAATGVDVYLYATGSDGKEVALKPDGSNSVEESIAQGDSTLNFAASVKQSSDTAITTGSINSNVTLNMDYE
ncbi:fimbrial protein [Pantoea latae]|nr:fimbrial protein [Pantoea latae]